MKRKILKYLILPCLLFLFMAPIVLAEDVQLKPPLGVSNFDAIAERIITAALGISGVLALIAFVFGGITWMTSSGDAGKVTKGKNMMIWAIWGLVVIFASYAILEFVFKALVVGGGNIG